jgi:hypothetical protein
MEGEGVLVLVHICYWYMDHTFLCWARAKLILIADMHDWKIYDFSGFLWIYYRLALFAKFQWIHMV